MDNEEKIKELEEKNAKLQEELQNIDVIGCIIDFL
jgi:hypothetical protein